MEGRPTTDSEEVEELRQLISSPNRESSLTAAAYMHFEVAADNALIAQKERDEKVERDQRIRAAKEERRRKVTEYAQSCRDVIINTKKVMQEKVTATKAQVRPSRTLMVTIASMPCTSPLCTRSTRTFHPPT